MLGRGQGKEMRLWISPAERRVTIACGGREVVKVKGHQHHHQRQQQQPQQLHHRRVSCRSVLLTLLVVGVVFVPFLFSTASFVSLDGATATLCRSMNCLSRRYGPRMFGGSISQELMNELKLVLLEVDRVDMGMKVVEAAPQSFSDLVADVSSHPHQDIKTFALK